MNLSDRVVAITGAAGGIGSALAHAYAARGARVALFDLRAEALAPVVTALRDAGHEVCSRAFDVRDPEACAEAIEAVVARWGGVDVLKARVGRCMVLG